MKLVFKRIEIHSFMSFEDEQFDFSSANGMTLIQGKNNDIPSSKNGTGKSNLGASLLYVLFGQLQNKIKNENVVNRYADDKDMRLVLWFSSDSIEYKIARGMNKGKNTYLNLYKISKDNDEEDITKSTISETQQFLENEILHCDLTIFLRTMLLTADQTYNFYMLKKADKKEFVEKLFDISVFGEMYELIHKDSLKLDKNIIAHQNQLMVLNNNSSTYAEQMKSYEEQKNSKKKMLVESLDKTTKEYEMLSKKQINKNEQAVSKLNDAIEKLEIANRNLKSKISQNDTGISKIELATHKLESTKSASQNIVDKHSELLSKLCNDCQPIFKKYYSIDESLSAIDAANAKIAKLKEKKTAIVEDSKQCDSKSKTIESKISIARERLSNLTRESNELVAQMNSLDFSIKSYQQQIKNIDLQENPYKQLAQNNEQSIKTENETLNNLENKHNYLKFAENIVSQDTLRKFIIKDLVTLLNNRIKTYLTKLGAKYYVVFDENMDYDFITSNGTCEFGNFSAGERMRLMIATSFAFRDFMSIRNGLNSNILILDEYFDSAIDSLCVESIMNILKEYSKNQNQNIFVISHRSEVSLDNFNRVLCIEKTNNISKIAYVS